MPYKKLSQTHLDKIIGIKQTTKAINSGKVDEVYIAQDADLHIKEKIERIAGRRNVAIIYVDSKDELGRSCGIDVAASTVALRRE